jgi:hypothetical protein
MSGKSGADVTIRRAKGKHRHRATRMLTPVAGASRIAESWQRFIKPNRIRAGLTTISHQFLMIFRRKFHQTGV